MVGSFLSLSLFFLLIALVSASISNSAGSSDCIRVAFAHGNNPGNSDTIEYVNISTGGDAVDFGNLSTARNHLGGCSNGHGGL